MNESAPRHQLHDAPPNDPGTMPMLDLAGRNKMPCCHVQSACLDISVATPRFQGCRGCSPAKRFRPPLQTTYCGTGGNFCKFRLGKGFRALAALSAPIGQCALGADRTPQARATPNQYGICLDHCLTARMNGARGGYRVFDRA